MHSPPPRPDSLNRDGSSGDFDVEEGCHDIPATYASSARLRAGLFRQSPARLAAPAPPSNARQGFGATPPEHASRAVRIAPFVGFRAPALHLTTRRHSSRDPILRYTIALATAQMQSTDVISSFAYESCFDLRVSPVTDETH